MAEEALNAQMLTALLQSSHNGQFTNFNSSNLFSSLNNNQMLQNILKNPALLLLLQHHQQLQAANHQHDQQNTSQHQVTQSTTEIPQQSAEAAGIKTPKSMVKLERPKPISPAAMTALNLNVDATAMNFNFTNQLHHQPLSSTTSIDEGVMTSSTSPTETASGTASPNQEDFDHELMPKESESASRKRSGEIQNLLLKKKGRLDVLVDVLHQKKSDSEHGDETLSTTTEKTCDFNIDRSHDFQIDGVPADWKATNNEVFESPEAFKIPYDQVFAKVPGRLSLLSNVTKYPMTVGEVRRRLLGPEAFNFSLLGALLRRAKMPEKSHALLRELRMIGLEIPKGRRRGAEKTTLMSALTESEAEKLCDDFRSVSENHFPAKEFAIASLQHSADQNRLRERLLQLSASREMIDDFTQWLEMDRSEIRDTKPTPILPIQIQEPLSTYSMMTHGFGTPGLLVGVAMFRKFINQQLQMVEDGLKMKGVTTVEISR